MSSAGGSGADGAATPAPNLTTSHAALTHTGLLREANEDNYLAIPEQHVYVVADGMGGHVAGQLASEICVQTAQSYFERGATAGLIDMDAFTGLSRPALELAEALLVANQHIFGRAQRERELNGMGTTAVAVRLTGNKVAVSHAGDSRCYLYRDGDLAQVTLDHSLSNFLLSLGREIEARYAEQTMSNVIMRALGLEGEVAVDTKEFLVQAGDRLLLCSDGLSDLVEDDVIRDVLTDIPRTERDKAANELVELALAAGGRDNITVVLIDIDGEGPRLPRSSFSETLELPASVVMGDSTPGTQELDPFDPALEDTAAESGDTDVEEAAAADTIDESAELADQARAGAKRLK